MSGYLVPTGNIRISKDEGEYKETWGSKRSKKFKTELRRGTALRRNARTIGNWQAGAMLGGSPAIPSLLHEAITNKSPGKLGLASRAAGGVGTLYGQVKGINRAQTKAIQRGDIRITNRETGKRVVRLSPWSAKKHQYEA